MDQLFDVDGTLLDITHRLKFLREKPKSWKKFRDPKQKRWDEPIRPVIEIMKALRLAGHTSIIVSARIKDEEEVTRDTLREWVPDIDDIPMYLRSDKDYRKDAVVKAMLLDKIRNDGYNPVMVFDDRPQVINMWHETGLKVADVRDPSKGDF